MKTIDEREMQKTAEEKQAKAERSKGNRSYSERVRVNDFVVHLSCAFSTSDVKYLYFLHALHSCLSICGSSITFLS